MPTTSKVVEAYSLLGLEQGCSLETVKSAYKQIALRTHPDKNPDNPDATAEFQRVSGAYNVLLKHLDPSSRPSPGHPFGFSAGTDYDCSDDEDYDDEDVYYEAHMQYYLYLFERMMSGGGIYIVTPGPYDSRFRRRPSKQEYQEEYKQRLQSSHEEQLAAQERRKRESIAQKERQARAREQERLEGGKRRKEKAQKKKAQAEVDRKASEERIQILMKKAQEIRSAVFDAARKGDPECVKKGIRENGVDAAGGEIKPGCADFVKTPPEDPMETLMHISTTKGDLDLIKWLDSHSADPEERNKQGMTAFHLAMRLGQILIVEYFIETYPPEDCSAVYQCSGNDHDNLLSLALQSRKPELVWIVLDKKLATSNDLSEAWTWASSEVGQAVLRGSATANDLESVDAISQLLKKYGGFFMAKGTKAEGEAADWGLPKAADADHAEPAPEQPRSVQPTISNTQKQANVYGRGRGRGRGRGKRQSRGQSRPHH